MICFKAAIKKFEKKGEKTGWTYIEIPATQAEKLKAGCKVSFRVKGTLDLYPIEKTALLPTGEGNFILPINATLRKGIGKKAGDTLQVKLETDNKKLKLSADFIACLRDDERAYTFFNTLPHSHQQYFSKWIESAKTTGTKTKRITMAVIALGNHQGYSEMIRANKTL
jgi:hypothetical protein